MGIHCLRRLMSSAPAKYADAFRKNLISPTQLTILPFQRLQPITLPGGQPTPQTPIIPSGSTAILALGRAVDTPVVEGGVVAVAPMMPLSLAFDHRVIDGGLGQRFFRMLIENLEEPALFLAG